jgi:hypothetical protein
MHTFICKKKHFPKLRNMGYRTGALPGYPTPAGCVRVTGTGGWKDNPATCPTAQTAYAPRWGGRLPAGWFFSVSANSPFPFQPGMHHAWGADRTPVARRRLGAGTGGVPTLVFLGGARSGGLLAATMPQAEWSLETG